MDRSRRGRSTKPGVALSKLRVRIIGPGRAGQSFAAAWSQAGVDVDVVERRVSVDTAASNVDAVMIATPDHAIAATAAAIEPGEAAVLHCSGATGLGPVAHHARHGSIHPLMALPDAKIGAARLSNGGWFAVVGDPVAAELVAVLNGKAFEVSDSDRALYHAAACVSANHTVALLAQIERLAHQVGVPIEAFLQMAQASLDDVSAVGAAAALTGPAARGDHGTLEAHRDALPADELDLYNALVTAAENLASTRQRNM